MYVRAACVCCKSSSSTATTSRLRDARKYIRRNYMMTRENRDGRDPRRSSASRKLTTVERCEIQEEVLRLKNPEYFQRETDRGERFSEGFSKTDGRFVLSSSSLCLFLDPRETRVPLSSRFEGLLAIVSARTRVE